MYFRLLAAVRVSAKIWRERQGRIGWHDERSLVVAGDAVSRLPCVSFGAQGLARPLVVAFTVADLVPSTGKDQWWR